MKYKRTLISTSLTFFILACFSFLAISRNTFSFTGYLTERQLGSTITHLIPRGTQREEVERIFVELGGADTRENEARSNEIQYIHKRLPAFGPNRQWTITVLYDRANTVRQIFLSGFGPLYDETPPNDQEDPTIFRFEDYRSPRELVDAFRVMFPPGTPEERVTQVFVDWQYATKLSSDDDPLMIVYQKTIDRRDEPSLQFLWTITVLYNKDRSLTQILVSGAPVLRTFQHKRQYWKQLINSKLKTE